MPEIRKINPKIIPLDVCQRSLDWLEIRARDWFQNNLPDHGKIWFADENTRGLSENFPEDNEMVEIILTGSFFIRMLESPLWPFKNFRLWTFSTRLKELLIEFYKISPDEIGVIGRVAPSVIPAPDYKGEVNFIYAGRLSLTKNITSVIRLVSTFQHEHGLKVTLDIFGEPDDLPDESIGRYDHFHLEETIKNLVEELPWNEKPVFHGNVPQNEWTKINRSHPHFISLSSSMYEDFGTAVHMASQIGWPCLLSDWGGHGDSSNSSLVPMHLVARTQELVFLQELRTRALARQILKNGLPFVAQKPDIGFIPKKALTKSALQNAVNDFILRWGPEVLYCTREKMNYFADTPKGIALFKIYHSFFGQKQAEEVMIVNDFIVNPQYQISWDGHSFDVVYLRELFNPYYLKRLESYKKITIFELGTERSSVLNFLKNILGLTTPIDEIRELKR